MKLKIVTPPKDKKLSDLKFLEKIKSLAITALFSDDFLFGKLVLKGGNAIDIVYKLSARASIDLDFSMSDDFEEKELHLIRSKIEKALKNNFDEEGLYVFDIRFLQRPKTKNEEIKDFWGGYRIEFKIIEKTFLENKSRSLEEIRKNSKVVGANQKRVFRIEISKYEYCVNKQKQELNGSVIYVYTPEMIVLEKIRAICQQMPEYKKIIKSQSPTARAKDFFDIYIVITHFQIDLNNETNKLLLKRIFEIKKVPLNLLGQIHKYKEYHRQDFLSLKATIRAGVDLKDFDYYFDFVVDKIAQINL